MNEGDEIYEDFEFTKTIHTSPYVFVDIILKHIKISNMLFKNGRCKYDNAKRWQGMWGDQFLAAKEVLDELYRCSGTRT